MEQPEQPAMTTHLITFFEHIGAEIGTDTAEEALQDWFDKLYTDGRTMDHEARLSLINAIGDETDWCPIRGGIELLSAAYVDTIAQMPVIRLI